MGQHQSSCQDVGSLHPLTARSRPPERYTLPIVRFIVSKRQPNGCVAFDLDHRVGDRDLELSGMRVSYQESEDNSTIRRSLRSALPHHIHYLCLQSREGPRKHSLNRRCGYTDDSTIFRMFKIRYKRTISRIPRLRSFARPRFDRIAGGVRFIAHVGAVVERKSRQKLTTKIQAYRQGEQVSMVPRRLEDVFLHWTRRGKPIRYVDIWACRNRIQEAKATNKLRQRIVQIRAESTTPAMTSTELGIHRQSNRQSGLRNVMVLDYIATEQQGLLYDADDELDDEDYEATDAFAHL